MTLDLEAAAKELLEAEERAEDQAITVYWEQNPPFQKQTTLPDDHTIPARLEVIKAALQKAREDGRDSVFAEFQHDHEVALDLGWHRGMREAEKIAEGGMPVGPDAIGPLHGAGMATASKWIVAQIRQRIAEKEKEK